MLFKRTTLFRIFGFDVKADASWIFLTILFAWTYSENIYPAAFPDQTVKMYQMMALATVAGLFVSVVAHELGHALMAEYYDMPIDSITLFIFGGVAEIKGEPSHPKGEFMMALAGPLMSVLMGIFFLSTGKVYDGLFDKSAVSLVMHALGTLNLVLAAFNMIPALPMDGGRVFRALVWQYKKNFVIATRIASSLGESFAYGLISYACYMIAFQNQVVVGMWTGISGLFAYATCSYSLRQTESRSLLSMETVSRFMTTNAAVVSPDILISDLVQQYLYKYYQRSFPVIDNGQLKGIITLQSVLALDRRHWEWRHVASLMEPVNKLNTVPSDFNAADALDLMQKNGRENLLIADDGEFKGIVSLSDLAAYLSITMKIDSNRSVETSRGI